MGDSTKKKQRPDSRRYAVLTLRRNSLPSTAFPDPRNHRCAARNRNGGLHPRRDHNPPRDFKGRFPSKVHKYSYHMEPTQKRQRPFLFWEAVERPIRQSRVPSLSPFSNAPRRLLKSSPDTNAMLSWSFSVIIAFHLPSCAKIKSEPGVLFSPSSHAVSVSHPDKSGNFANGPPGGAAAGPPAGTFPGSVGPIPLASPISSTFLLAVLPTTGKDGSTFRLLHNPPHTLQRARQQAVNCRKKADRFTVGMYLWTCFWLPH